MDELLIIGLNALITGISVLIGGRILWKWSKRDMKEEVIDYIQSEEGAKMLYTIGAMVGNGAKSGFGLSRKGGKFGFQDLLMQVVGKYIGGTIGGQEQAAPEQEIPSFGNQ